MALLVALAGSGCGGGGGDDGAKSPAKPRLVVSAAASLKDAFTEYGEAFPDATARFSFAGSDVLAAQIRQGLKPDVYAAANVSLPGQLASVGLVDAPVRFASNELVLAVPRGSEVRSLADIEKKGVRLAIGSRTVPVGSYTRTLLERLAPVDSKAIYANVRSEEPDVTGIVGKLTEGAVDAGFLYKTDVRATNGRLRLVRLDPSLLPVVTYGVSVVKGAAHPEEAKAFIYGLLAGAGRAAMRRAGFGPGA